MIQKKAISDYKLDPLIEKRWSPRAFDKDKKVEREKVLSLCEAARWAPSCFNDQPWRYLVFDKAHNEDDFNKGFNCLVEWNQGWVKNCSLLFAVLSYDKFKKNGDPNHWSKYDCGAASENICLQATSMGLMAHQMAGFNKEKLISDFDIPENHSPIAMIAVGYQADQSVLEKDYKDQEDNKRIREPLGKNFFDGKWGKGIV